MRYGVICIKKGDYCTVVSNGNYNDLLDVFDIIKENYTDDSIRLIETDEEEYNDIKGDATKINEKYGVYFSAINTSAYLTDDSY